MDKSLNALSEMMSKQESSRHRHRRSKKAVRFARFRDEIVVPVIPKVHHADVYYSRSELDAARKQDAMEMGLLTATPSKELSSDENGTTTDGLKEESVTCTWRGLEGYLLDHNDPTAAAAVAVADVKDNNKIVLYIQAVLKEHRRQRRIGHDQDDALRRFSKNLSKPDRVAALKMGNRDAELSLGSSSAKSNTAKASSSSSSMTLMAVLRRSAKKGGSTFSSKFKMPSLSKDTGRSLSFAGCNEV